MPTCNDLHPDHRFVYDEFMISLFHAGGNIWPELGEPLARIPYVSTYAVYCDCVAPPTTTTSSSSDAPTASSNNTP